MANELEKTANVENEPETKEAQKTESTDLDKRIRQLEAENAKLKQSVTNASADASKWKKQLQEKMTEEERTKAEQDAANAAMQQELELLRNERNVANHKAQFVSIGFDEDTAQEVAESFKTVKPDDLTVLFAGIRKFIESHDKSIRSQNLMSNPVLNGGEAKKKMTKEEFDKMGYKERVAMLQSDPDLYHEMTKSS